VLEGENGFRKLAGYRALIDLVAALHSRDTQSSRTWALSNLSAGVLSLWDNYWTGPRTVPYPTGS